MAINTVRTIDDRVRVRTVLASVSDKSGLEILVPGLLAACPGLSHPLDRRHLRRDPRAARREGGRLPPPGLRLHGPARDAGRAGEDPRLQDLPRPALRDLQPRAPGRPGDAQRRGHRHGRREPLPVPEDRRRGRRHARGRAREHRHRRPVHGARRGQELPPGRGAHRSRRLRRAWSPSSRRGGGALCARHPVPPGAEGLPPDRAATTRPSPRTSRASTPASWPRRYEVR